MKLRRPLIVLALTAAVVSLLATPAQAHPLGNFSINQYAGLTLSPSRVDVLALADIAEIPTLQEKPQIDTDGDGALSPAETLAYAASECGRYSSGLAVTVGDGRLSWAVTAPTYEIKPGAGGLATSRLSCRLSAPASLSDRATLRVSNDYRSGRVGWRELTAVGAGVRLNSALPAVSLSHELTDYPRDLLASAPDVRSATIQVGESGAAAAGTPSLSTAAPDWLATAQSRVEAAVGGHLTPVVVFLAFLLALLLGAGHAALPGHGKTVMAAYFAGRKGRIRDALAVGGTVTLAHTGGVLVVGLLLTTSTALAGEQVLSWLAAASGVLVTAVGIAMLVTALRSRRAGTIHHHGDHSHSHGHDHGGHPHSHSKTGGRLGLAGIGLAGGLVPSPSALVVLLGAIGLGRTMLGVLLVLAYGIGMAGTLTAVGLLLVFARRKLGGFAARAGRITQRLSAGAPTATAALVVLVGLGMGLRAVT
ncbi:ABC-type nickel/cobalt efflux system permease component RcnA [Actinoplanes tereljensis]|uniref:ABC-type nickel/cobalt efflux system permease component RcnA n=1 Tax=Paractinoplanes tereljensis TaxID=571912 RepID=A0A919NVP4_9ACTN|nr:hypothetical protein [Actinoplanes tereljensis]GIF25110.1 hypothetical protein Ate02nite_78400 [Actinoplanes tereljensis]